MGTSNSKPKPLVCQSPVPSDIEIAQSIEPLPISDIATQLGLRPKEVLCYGPTKAKVCPYAACVFVFVYVCISVIECVCLCMYVSARVFVCVFLCVPQGNN
jgi:hypothetical protein